MIFSEDRLPLFRTMLEGSQARAAETAATSSAPAPETTASESAAFHNRGEEDLRYLAASPIAICYPGQRLDVPIGPSAMACVAGPMSKLRHLGWPRPLLLACTLLSVASAAAIAQGQGAAQDRARGPADACLGFAGGLSLGAPLPLTKAKLRPGGTLRIVAFGSSSTTGFGAFGKGTAFPDVMKDELLRLHPDVTIELINSGRIMEDLGDNISRINDDVLRYKPDLLIWQIGTNDVVWRGIADNAKEMLADAVKRIKAAKTDVVLFDLQYAPLVTLTSRYERMERIIADVAAEQRVGHFPRFLLMKRAIDAGVTGLVSWDGLHNSAEGYACVGVALARMIDAAARQ
jgi:acyl-CoA thioesterase-1